MNITLSLLKRTGLSKRDADDLTDIIREDVKSLRQELAKAQRDMDFWKREIKKRQPMKKCTKCKEPISLWPFEDEGYYLLKNKVRHISCSGEVL